MKLSTSCLFSVVFLASLGLILSDNVAESDHSTSSADTETTTESPPHSTTHTELPVTTTEKTHITTPVLTTEESHVTTTALTTEEPKTTSTTTPAPQPTVPTFEVRDQSDNYCISVQSLTSLRITYKDKSNASRIRDFDLKDEDIKSSGQCLPNNTFVSLSWQPKERMGQTSYWYLNLTFAQFNQGVMGAAAAAPDSYGVSQIALNYTLDENLFPETAKSGSVLAAITGTIFKAHVGNFYACSANETIPLKISDQDGQADVLLHTRDTKIQAFMQSKKDPFVGQSEPCEADSKTSSLVPILVGVGLAIMILIALVVFLIGSRRRAATYESL